MIRAATYSPTATVAAMAVTARRSMPHRPLRNALIMETVRPAATSRAKTLANHWAAESSPAASNTATTAPAAMVPATNGKRITASLKSV
ncbi:hypothetical protein [Arthrobacter sp. UYCo732]|uniref:hypothetical protein n=1 Tax=Arthrobacter sp. UYCo732 TaxID=3156336 RepID=UPI003395F1B4